MQEYFVSQVIAEERIRRAMEEGQFDNLEGAGRPLKPDGTENLPPELRMAFRVLRNAGYVPAEVAQEREITQAIELLSAMEDERERYRQVQKLNVMIMKMNEQRCRPVNLEAADDYYRRIVERVRLAGRGGKDRDQAP
ncbi:MAG: DUF1992 domain-containing protein [Pseudodesulfovibrio sp.]